MRAAHVELERSQDLRNTNYHEFAHHDQRQPRTGWLERVVGKSARGPNNLLSNSSSCYPRSGPDPLEWTIPPPSEGNATAKRGYQRRAPIACSLLPSACTLTHAFACCPTRTQRISRRHRNSIIARHRMPCRWSTPQRKVVRATDELGEKAEAQDVPTSCDPASPAGARATFPQWPLSPFRRSAPLASTISRACRPIPVKRLLQYRKGSVTV
jgi:hypothetical protein